LTSVLRCTSLTKRYPGVVALDGLDFEAKAGSVHAVLGENGAGKSTFIKTLGGTVRPDTGTIEIGGRTTVLPSVRAARRQGIGVAYQELSLIPDLTVGQNIWLNKGSTNPLAILAHKDTIRRTEELYARIGAPVIDPRRKVKDLTMAARHVVEIVSSVAVEPRILVLDEATAALPAAEAQWALGLASDLAKRGTLVLFISHRLHECREVAQVFTVLRRGRAIRSGKLAEASDDVIIEDMLGRKPRMLYPPPKRPPSAETLLSVRGLSVPHELRELSFDLHAGEILGVGGLEGQGQSAVMLSLFGMKRCWGDVFIGGRKVHIRSPGDAFNAGVGLALVPEDRRYQGLHLEKSLRENIALPVLSKLSRLGFLPPGADVRLAWKAVADLGIKASSIEQPAKTLSGGNQQKVVVAKLLAVGARILLFHDVTRGIDVGTKAEIFHLARDLAATGHAILFYSSENQELVNMCDRILVLRAGVAAAVLEGGERTEERILQAAMGLARPAVASTAAVS
jgi:ribose transport system ATP-binding protein